MKKYRFAIILTLLLFVLYTFLDNYGYQNYSMMYQAFGLVTVSLSILLNIILSSLSGYTIYLTYQNMPIKGKATSYSLTSIANLFAAVFAGCTSCGLNILAAFTVGFVAPIVTPGAIEFKLIALGLVSATYFIIKYRIKHTVCEVKK